jgi:hypothetical protein
VNRSALLERVERNVYSQGMSCDRIGRDG